MKQGNRYTYLAPNGIEQRIEVTSTVGEHIGYKHIQGKSVSGSVHVDYFKQLVSNGYFKEVEA